MSILVTGGAGFIGPNFIRMCLEKEIPGPIVVLDKLTYASDLKNLDGLSRDKVHFFEGDINDETLVMKLLGNYKPKAVINFAAESHVDRSIHSADQFIHTNINGTYNLLKCSKKYYCDLNEIEKKAFRFLQISTDEVYGSLSEREAPFTEENSYRPNNPYAASKASADHLARSFYSTYNFPILITNCSNNFGFFQHEEKLIPTIIFNALKEKPIPIYGDGKNIRDWIYVKDHCAALLCVLEKGLPGESYNIGSSNEKSNLEMASLICEYLDKINPRKNGRPYFDLVTFVEDRLGHDWRYAIDSKKLSNDLGFHFKTDFKEALCLSVDFYVQKFGYQQ